jgi:methylase of polypeptide subunit release factors
MRRLPEEYRKEPEVALASGRDGLDHTRAILAAAREHLNPRGLLVVEIGHNRRALERAYPRLPFEWPPRAGDRASSSRCAARASPVRLKRSVTKLVRAIIFSGTKTPNERCRILSKTCRPTATKSTPR